MTDSDPSDSWEPEDGAGYIPTEEGGTKQGAVPIEELEALVQEWEEQRTGYMRIDNAVEACAQELQEILEDYE